MRQRINVIEHEIYRITFRFICSIYFVSFGLAFGSLTLSGTPVEFVFSAFAVSADVTLLDWIGAEII